MKYIFFVLLLLISGIDYSQKYVLIDKKMTQPISYTNTITMEHSYKNLFAVGSDKIHQFITELEKIAAQLSDTKKPLPETFDFNVGKTRFFALKVRLAKESRLDVVLTSNCDGNKITMHLSDAKVSNASNAYFINTWIKYIKSYVK